MGKRLPGLAVVFWLGCGGGGGGGDQPDADPVAVQQQAVTATQGLGVAAALTAPLAADGRTLDGDPGADTTEGRARAEHGISGNSVVEPSGCAVYAWNGGLSGTVTFTGCTFGQTGIEVSGAVTLTVTIRPARFALAFTALRVTGVGTFDGSASLTIAEGAGPTIDADLSWMSSTGMVHLMLTNLRIADAAVGVTDVTLDGSGSITTASLSGSFTINSVVWAVGACLPKDGSLAVTSSGLTITVTFLATTPTDGKVNVSPSLKPQPQDMFPPCGSPPAQDAGP